MLHDHNPKPLSKLEVIACHLTRTDPDFLRLCAKGERIRVVHEAIWVGLMFIFLTALWSTVLSICGLTFWQRLPLAAVLVAILLLFEVSLTSTDTHLRGILHHGRRPWSFFGRVAARLFIAALLNAGTATAFDMYLMRKEALQAEARVVDEENAPIRHEYDKRISDFRAIEVKPFEDRIANLKQRQAAVIKQADDARTEASSAFAAKQAQELEQHRQDDGFAGREHGHGNLAREAERQAELAGVRADVESDQDRNLNDQAQKIELSLKTANADLVQATQRFNQDAARLQTERDGRLVYLTDGPLTVMRGWLLLRSAPETASAVFLTTVIAWVVLMTLELTFFLSRVVFRGEQLHDLFHQVALRRAAMQAESELHDDVREHNRRPPLRIVADNDDGQDANEGG